MASVAGLRTRGTMLWFNGAKDLGALRTDAGDRLEVPGSAFADGHKPVERCAGKPIEFEVADETVSEISFLPDLNPRRARMRHRR